MSETTGNDKVGEPDERDLEREDPSIAGQPEIPARGDEAGSAPDAREVGRLDEREERQHAVQQHGDTFAVDSDQPTDTSGVERRVTALPGNERDRDDSQPRDQE